MTTPVRTPSGATPRRELRSAWTPPVEVLVCGAIDRGDDAAPFAAIDLFEGAAPSNARIRKIGRLDVDDLLSIRAGAGVVIVDAATGIESGSILELPLRAFLDIETDVRPRSSHALAMPEVIGLADMIRGRPLVGRIVVIGARRFTLGSPLTRRVAAAVPALSRAIGSAVQRVTELLLDHRSVAATAEAI